MDPAAVRSLEPVTPQTEQIPTHLVSSKLAFMQNRPLPASAPAPVWFRLLSAPAFTCPTVCLTLCGSETLELASGSVSLVPPFPKDTVCHGVSFTGNAELIDL